MKQHVKTKLAERCLCGHGKSVHSTKEQVCIRCLCKHFEVDDNNYL